jgi:uncharacterized membrane protein
MRDHGLGRVPTNSDMGDLVVVAFPTEAKAQEVGKKLLELQQEYLIEVEDAVVATKRPNGPVKFNNLLRRRRPRPQIAHHAGS